MSKSRLPLYLGLGAAGIGGYYLYQSGGNVNRATASAKADANRARHKLDTTTTTTTPTTTTNTDIGERAGAKVDQLLDTTSSKAKETNEGAKEGLERADRLRHDTARSMGATVDKWDRKVEEKAAEAKKSVGGWFGK